MNTNIKNVIISLGSFVAGAAAGYFICKKKLGEEYARDIKEIKDFYRQKIDEIGVQDSDFDPEEYDEEEGFNIGVDNYAGEDAAECEVSEKEARIHYDRVMKERGRPIINYNKPPLHSLLNQVAEEEPENEGDPDYEAEIEARSDEYARRKNENKSNGQPYVIDYDEYMDGPEEYERQVLYYYAEDRVLCEDDDSLIEDEEELVGLDYEDTLDMQTTAWVRNDSLNIIYEIHRIDDSYTQAVSGVIETPREREFRIKGRRKEALDQ